MLIYIAEDNEEIIAMGCIHYFSLPPNDLCPSGKTAYMGNIFTCTNYRRKGITANILNLIVEEAKGNGGERLLLNTSDMGENYTKIGLDSSPTAMVLYSFGIIPKNG